jgi:hypothetical protein
MTDARFVVWTPLNISKSGHPNDRSGDIKWTHERLRLYLKYTLPSLQRQTDQNFDKALICQPGLEEHIVDFALELHQAGVNIFMGHPRMRRYYAGLQENLIMLRSDSDDIMGPGMVKFIKQFHVEHPDRGGCTFVRGFVYVSTTNELFRWEAPGCSYFSWKYSPGQVGKKGQFRGCHVFTRQKRKPAKIRERYFCLVHHEYNLSIKPKRCYSKFSGTTKEEDKIRELYHLPKRGAVV